MDLTSYLAPYGISANNLSSTVKGALQRVLETAGYKAVQELSVILDKQAAKYGVVGTTPTAQQAAAQNALDGYNAQQAEAARKAKRKQGLYILVGILATAALVSFALIYRHKHRLHHG